MCIEPLPSTPVHRAISSCSFVVQIHFSDVIWEPEKVTPDEHEAYLQWMLEEQVKEAATNHTFRERMLGLAKEADKLGFLD